jgi:hypothetical protein
MTVRDRKTKKIRPCRGHVTHNSIFCVNHQAAHNTSYNPPHNPPPSPPHSPPARPVTPEKKKVQPLDSTPYRNNLKRSPNALIDDRCKIFCTNLNQELTLVKLDCQAKIDELFGELEYADAYGRKLNEVAEKFKLTDQWNNWLAEMQGSYKSEDPLKPQRLFHEIMATAQLLLTKSITEQVLVANHHSFRNLLRENISLQVSHDEEETPKSLRPDIVVVRKEHETSDLFFGQFLCVIEHKRGEKAMSSSNAKIQSLVRSTQTFNDNPFRHYLYSVFVAGTKLRLFQLNRGGIVRFDNDLDVSKNPESFVKFVAWLSFASAQQLGHGKHLDIINGVEFKCDWKKFAQIVRPEALDSRGTTVWDAWEPVKPTGLEDDLARLDLNRLDLSDKPQEPQTEPQMILKMQWTHEHRKTTEAEFLEEIDGMPGVPKLYGACIGPATRDFCNPNSQTVCETLKSNASYTSASVTTASGSYIPSSGRSGTKSPKPNVTQAPSSRRTDGDSVRVQHWILTSYCGVSIDDSDKKFTTVHRIRALRSVIHAICNLFCRKKRIIHRDISGSNIRIAPLSPTADKVQSAGYLIDFDMASYWCSEGSGARSRTGTPLYMALAVLSDASTPPIHLPWYDIESVFWVLLFGEGLRADPDFLSDVDTSSFKRLKNDKMVLLSLSGWVKLKKSEFMQGHVGLLLSRLRGLLFDCNWKPTAKVADGFIFDEFYTAERFQASTQDDMAVLGENIARALVEAVKIIDGWFKECIDGLQSDY